MAESGHPLSGKKVLVIGLGISGISAAQLLLKRGAQVTALDKQYPEILSNPQLQELAAQGACLIGEGTPCSLEEFALVVVSPGIPPTQKHYAEAVRLGIPLIGEMELGCQELLRQCHFGHGHGLHEPRCVGITGTNGKTTVTLLVEHLLCQAGIDAAAIGNIGTPLTGHTTHAAYVIELSSFQLETMQTPFLDCGVILNITPDHLDRYASMQEYAQAKLRIAKLIKPRGKLFIEAAARQAYGKEITDAVQVIPYGYDNEWVHTDTFKIYLQGLAPIEVPEPYRGRRSHDLENLMAAYALCLEMGIDPELFGAGVRTFKKPPHRIEYVRTHAGVKYYDDSKGTNLDAVMRAVEAMEQPVHLIAGGVDKGAPYLPWASCFKKKVKAVYAIGQASKKIEADLAGHFQVDLCVTLEEAVKKAAVAAREGEAVLLSPGCSSFDMFKDYAHRGDEFKRIVNGL
jgi:UDP-N-acetylmuramoylalanine--D-glutamate ligase